jgi:hypothetical protein
LICVGADEEWARKVYALQGLRGVERQVGLTRQLAKKSSGYLVEPQNQDRRLGMQRRDPAAPRSFDAGGRVAGSQGLRREDAVYSNGVAM